MAEIEGGGGGGKHKGGKPKGKKMSTRVDFTPMVDLGFLLITFFMLTTSMNKPQTMEINMPIKKDVTEEDQTKIKESQAMTIILGEKDRIFYYFGITEPKVEVTNFGKDGIRKTLLEENKKRNPVGVDSIAIYKKQLEDNKIKEDVYKRKVARIKGFKDGLIVLIKADDKSKYKNLVDILDEMLICNIGRYAIVDITDIEKELIKSAEAAAVTN